MSAKLIITGHVQGVGCRYYCAQVARRLKISGSATNLNDGSVCVIIDTDDSDLIASYIDALQHNLFRLSFFGNIRGISQQPYSGHLGGGDYEW